MEHIYDEYPIKYTGSASGSVSVGFVMLLGLPDQHLDPLVTSTDPESVSFPFLIKVLSVLK